MTSPGARAEAAAARKRFALAGTVCSDTIRTVAGTRFGGVGGILYQAAALCALGDEVVLHAHYGRDDEERVRALTADWPTLRGEGLIAVPGAGNRVVLEYPAGGGERREVLESVSPPLLASRVLAGAAGSDLLLFALNSGFDMTLADWRTVVEGAGVPTWLDIHSLALDRVVGRHRRYVPLPEWEDWARGVSALQANRQEVACMLGRPDARPGAADIAGFARRALSLGVQAVCVTLGKDGVFVATAEGATNLRPRELAEARDTTGCGDVFAAGAVHRLARGASWVEAAKFGVDLAAQAAGVVGVRGTYELVRSLAAPPQKEPS